MLFLIVILLSISAVFIIQIFNCLLQVENSFFFSFHVSPLEVHTDVILLAFTTYMYIFKLPGLVEVQKKENAMCLTSAPLAAVASC